MPWGALPAAVMTLVVAVACAAPDIPTIRAAPLGGIPVDVPERPPVVATVPPAPPDAPAGAAGGDARVVAGSWTIDPYRGLGTWIDVYDWSAAVTDGEPRVGPGAVDRMADLGVRTLFVQVSHRRTGDLILEPGRLGAILERARARGLSVVAWYLPPLVDPDDDFARLMSAATLGVDGLAIDIEATDVADVAERNRRLIGLTDRLRAALGDVPLGAIVLEPVLIEDVSPRWWPGYPWRDLAERFDVFLPMMYWTNRSVASGWRDPFRYTAENLARLRARTGGVRPVHAIGGIGSSTSVADVELMIRALGPEGVIGASIYDFDTTPAEVWPVLGALRGIPPGPSS